MEWIARMSFALGTVFMSKTITTDSGPLSYEWQAAVQTDMVLPSDQLATMIVMADFARDWFDDACNEATKETAAARRREIIFAVCTLESYLLEWVRKILLSRYSHAELLGRLDKYFPGGQRNSIVRKWKAVPEALYADRLIKEKPDLNGKTWQTFKKTVYEYYRNALIHASVSRPQKKVTAFPGPPADWKAELGKLRAGWAIEIVAELIRGLNDKAGTLTPDWLDDP